MITVIETRAFIRTTESLWVDAQRSAFINWIAANPTRQAI